MSFDDVKVGMTVTVSLYGGTHITGEVHRVDENYIEFACDVGVWSFDGWVVEQ